MPDPSTPPPNPSEPQPGSFPADIENSMRPGDHEERPMSNLVIRGIDESDPFADQKKKVAILMSQIHDIIAAEVERSDLLGVMVVVLPDHAYHEVVPFRRHYPNKARDMATHVESTFHMARCLYDAALRFFKANRALVFQRADRDDPQPPRQPQQP